MQAGFRASEGFKGHQELSDASTYGSEGQEFESLRVRHQDLLIEGIFFLCQT